MAIVDTRPGWMSAERWAELAADLAADLYDIDDPPRGLIEALLADRSTT